MKYFDRVVDGFHWGCVGEEDESNCFNAVALAEEAIRPVRELSARRMRILAAKLKQVSGEYWWSWDEIQEEPVGVTSVEKTLLDVQEAQKSTGVHCLERNEWKIPVRSSFTLYISCQRAAIML